MKNTQTRRLDGTQQKLHKMHRCLALAARQNSASRLLRGAALVRGASVRALSVSLPSRDSGRASGVSGGHAAPAAAASAPGAADHEEEDAMYEDPRTAILEAALKHVARDGWSQEALAAGAQDLGYPSVTQGLFKNGAIDLVHYFMQVRKCRRARVCVWLVGRRGV